MNPVDLDQYQPVSVTIHHDFTYSWVAFLVWLAFFLLGYVALRSKTVRQKLRVGNDIFAVHAGLVVLSGRGRCSSGARPRHRADMIATVSAGDAWAWRKTIATTEKEHHGRHES